MTNHEAVTILSEMGKTEPDVEKREALMRACLALTGMRSRAVDLMAADFIEFVADTNTSS